jgi:FtsP/CotA-like multicopper oxidase with cupredoxin domain
VLPGLINPIQYKEIIVAEEKQTEQPASTTSGEEEDQIRTGLTRRQFFGASLGAAAALTVPAAAYTLASTAAPEVAKSTLPMLLQTAQTEDYQPVIIAAQNGLLETTFKVEKVTTVVGGETLEVRSYIITEPKGIHNYPHTELVSEHDEDVLNSDAPEQILGKPTLRYFPGPTLFVGVGETVKLKLVNNLLKVTANNEDVPGECYDPPPNSMDVFPNCFHGLNTTNMHYHGTHIHPDAPADDVLLAIGPKTTESDPPQTFDYEFSVHSNQSPGTHWYHPHKHGATAIQVMNGMAGALIIPGDFPGIDEISNAKDFVFVLQQIQADLNLHGPDPQFNTKPILINGFINPTVVMRAREVQRWRVVGAMIQANAIRSLQWREKGQPGQTHDIAGYPIALDGVQFTGPLPPATNEVIIAPGNRADFLLQAPATPGKTYELIAGDLKLDVAEDVAEDVEGDRPVVTVKIVEDDGTEYVKTLPTGNLWQGEGELPVYLKPITDQELENEEGNSRSRILIFSMSKGPGPSGGPAQFFIDGDQFEPGRTDQCMVLGTAEEWTIYNASVVAHPFHIHVNPYFVTEIRDPNGTLGLKAGHWHDTILLPPMKQVGDKIEPGYVVIRHRFVDFTGAFVLHCHILGHEDRGMMQRVEVVEAESICPVGSRWQDRQEWPEDGYPDKGVPPRSDVILRGD